MEIEQQTEQFKEFFLLSFTKELIKSYLNENEITKLKIIEEAEIESKKELAKEKTKEILREIRHPLKMSPARQLQTMSQQNYRPSTFTQRRTPKRLIIPRQKLPERLNYIQPTPAKEQIDLKKLNPFIRDPAIQMIECNGPDMNIIVKTPAKKTTNIKLNEEEIDEVIKIFSEVTRIPASQGVFRVAVSNLILSAIISEVIGTKFIIKKMRYPAPLPRGF